jgi:hypothetical protein
MVWPVYLMQIKIHTYINMVKNIPTIERSTKIRFGKHVSDSQAENTIVFNASDTAVNATNSGSIYMAPLRVAEIAGSNLVGYSASTKEVVDSSVPTSLLGGVTLQAATDIGNVTSNTVQFNNAITSFVASSFVGIQNTAPTHAISVADKVFIHNVNSVDRVTVVGNVRASKYTTTGNAVLLQDDNTNQIQVSGRIHSSESTMTKIGLANTAPAHALSIGNEGQVQMNVPTASIYALDTVGNVNAQNYRGDSYYLSNLTIENIVNQGNVTSNTVQFSNGLTGIYTTSNVDVGGNIFVRNNTDSAIYGTIAGANTIAGSTITATSKFVGDVNEASTSKNVFGSTITAGTKLVGDVNEASTSKNVFGSTITAGTKLVGDVNEASTTNDVFGKYISASTESGSKLTGQLNEASTSNAVYGGTITASTKLVGDVNEASTGKNVFGNTITAGTGGFSGDGSGISSLNQSNLSSAVSVTKGGTGLNTVTAGDILYASANDTVAGLDKGAGNTVLQMKTDGTLPEWTQTITGASLANPSLTGTITTLGLNNNRIPFTNGSGVLSSHADLQFDPTGTPTMTIGADVTITGAFKTQGTVDHFNTTNYTVTDPIIEVGNNNSTDTIDLGMIMTMNTANVVHGFRGDQKEYTIAYTHSNPSDTDIEPTLASGITDHPYITANIWGNVLSGNVTTTGMVDAATLKGNGANITHLNLGGANNTGKVSVVRGGTNIDTYTAGDILYASGSAGQQSTTLTRLAANDGKFLKSTDSAVVWADVSSNLHSIVNNGPATANITSNTIQFSNTVNSLTASGNVIVSGNVISTGVITLESSAGTRQALKVLNAIEVDPAVVGGGTSSKNVLAINRTTGEIYDSGGQGGSTMEFTHEEGSGDHANVSIGKAAWAGPTGESNLTMNTYGSNVLTVTGNISADNITIGALHVAASPFNLDDVASAGAGANVTSNVIQFTGPHASYGDNNFTTSKSISIGSNVNVTGNVFCNSNLTSQNLQLTNTQIATTWTSGSGTLEIDCKNKSYGTAPLTSIDADVAALSVLDLPSGGQIVVPLLASGADRKVSKAITTGIDQIAFTNDVSIAQNGHGLLTVSKLDANIYMNAISFTAA